ncbi:MAG: DUF4185 domain-containing protein [Clostridia bacterium]|nr:DUF4185 domain-containing protein [Clostridia bacterium]
MKLTCKILSGVLIPALTLPCLSLSARATESADSASPILTCTPADDWTALFDRAGTREGWLAADGIYSVALDGNDALSSASSSTKTLFFFSDTILGTASSTGRISRSNGMANHSAALLEGNLPDASGIQFYYGAKANMALSGDLNLFSQSQWLFDCFVQDGALYAIAFSQQNWKPSQIDLIKIPLAEDGTPQFNKYKRTRNVTALLKKLENFDYAYGMGVLCNTESAGAPDPDGYIYLYGYRDNFAAFSQKDLIVSRIHEDDFPDFDKLRYWNGSDWVEDIEASALILERVSCEVSVTPITVGPYKGKYIAVYTQDVQSDRIMYAIGDSPAGPFDTPVQCYTVPETGDTAAGGSGTLYTYNAKAHPHISPAGTLLISYNVNVNGVSMAQNTADYRPRFLSMDLGATEEEIAALQASAESADSTNTPTDPPSDPDGDGTDQPPVSEPSADPANTDGTEPPSSLLPVWIGAGALLAAVGVTVGILIGKRRRK